MLDIVFSDTGRGLPGMREVSICGHVLEEFGWTTEAGKHRLTLDTDGDNAAKDYLASARLGELSEYFSVVGINFRSPALRELESVLAYWETTRHEDAERAALGLRLRFDLAEWRRPWTFVDFIDAFARRLVAAMPDMHAFSGPSGSLMVTVLGLPASRTLRDRVEECVNAIGPVLAATIAALNQNARRDAVVTFFEFPASVRTACQQYLVYFVQFLRDLGIEADAELKEDAHRVLFSVTPRSGPEALIQIREALAVYLNLPASPGVFSSGDASADIAFQQLRANVFHLQGQLALSSAVIQAKDAVIQAKDAVIGAQLEHIRAANLSTYQYRQLMLPSGAKGEATDSADSRSVPDREPLFEDVVVTRYKAKFIEVDAPSILRKLKRRFFDGD